MIQKQGCSDKVATSLRKEQVLMLRSQGYTIRQICDALKIKSTTTVRNDIKSGVERKEGKPNFTAEEYRDLELNRCFERSGRLAEWRNRIEMMSLPLERQIQLILLIEDRDMKNQERLIKLLGLETLKIDQSDALDFNVLRERMLKVEERDRELEMYPALSGRVR